MQRGACGQRRVQGVESWGICAGDSRERIRACADGGSPAVHGYRVGRVAERKCYTAIAAASGESSHSA